MLSVELVRVSRFFTAQIGGEREIRLKSQNLVSTSAGRLRGLLVLRSREDLTITAHLSLVKSVGILGGFVTVVIFVLRVLVHYTCCGRCKCGYVAPQEKKGSFKEQSDMELAEVEKAL